MRVDGYTRLQPIGAGGFATVYEALQVKFNRRVALKVLNLGAEGTVDRDAFHTECITMGALSTHPNIVTIYDSGFTDEGLPFISMELCGGSFLDRIKRNGYLDPIEVAETGAAVARALSRAHTDGIMHSDVKPQNIFFTEYGAPSLGDFGIASVDSSRFGQGVAGVSLHYSAPELFDGEDPTPATDLYALGATLYTALAGRRPFAGGEGQTREQTMQRVLKDAPPPITEQPVAKQFEDLVFRLLEKDPVHRPRSAASVATTLGRLAADMGTTAAPAQTASRDTDATIRRQTSTPQSTPVAPERPAPSLRNDDAATRVRGEVPPETEIEAPKTQAGSKPTWLIPIGAVLALVVVVGLIVSQSGGGTEDSRLENSSDSTEAPPSSVNPEVVPLARLVAPEDLSVIVEGSTAIVSWSAVEGAEGYEVLDDRLMDSPIDTTELELPIELDPDWPRFCPDVSAFNGSNVGPPAVATGDNCVSIADG